MAVALSDRDRALLDGDGGSGLALAMRVLAAVAEAMGAARLLDITGAHIDGCLYQGNVGLDFVRRLAEGGAQVRVPTTLNVTSLDLLHPDLYRGDAEHAAGARQLMAVYEALGCQPTWTCAPYHSVARPGFGEQIAWAESNAIVFANSVLGARTHRYGDFLDICAALTGRAPAAGLHLQENRRGEVVFDVSGLPPRLLASDALFPALGHMIGGRTGKAVPVIAGLPAADEDQMKALGAAAAAAGSVGMFHAVGITPEAPDLSTALYGMAALETIGVTAEDIKQSRDNLTTAPGTTITAVSVGTPHASHEELQRIVALLAGRRVAAGIEAFASTGRDVAAVADASGVSHRLASAGFQLVTDTCTYITPILRSAGPVMTNSGKWAYYAPSNLGVQSIFGSLAEVVESAVIGSVWRDDELWDAP